MLLASQFSPLLHKLELVVQSWMGKHLTYAGRLKLIKSIFYDIVQFWPSIFPMPSFITRQIIVLVETFCGQAILWETSLFWWHGKLFVCQKMKGDWVCLTLRLETRVFFSQTAMKHTFEIWFHLDSMGASFLFKQLFHLECSDSKNFFTIMEINSSFKELTCWGF
jgi:hypothetical protein